MDSINKSLRLPTLRGLVSGPQSLLTPLHLGALCIALGVLTPIVALIWQATQADFSHWDNLITFVLPTVLKNTVLLLAGVAVMVGVIGVGSAWAVTAWHFPGRKILSWALLLPLAMPTYIVAFAWLDLLHPIGPLQTFIRFLLGFDSPRQFRLPDLRSLPGAIILLGLVLYPYVYLTTRAMFISQPAHLLEAARTLGCSATGTFFRVVLPMARPALAVGISLALLETLNDIGASEFLGVQTLTVTVYTTWISRSDLASAAQIACMMLMFIFCILTLEFYGRKKQGFSSRSLRKIKPTRIEGWRGWLLGSVIALPVILGFLAPVIFLAWESAKRLGEENALSPSLLAALQNTLSLAAGTTLVVVCVSLLVAWSARHSAADNAMPGFRRGVMRLSSLGYAVPGTILAIGFLTPAMAVDRWLADLMDVRGLPLMSAGVLLVICCAMRFQAIAIGALDSGLSRIPPSLEQASRLLGENGVGTFARIHFPLLRPALVSSALLVFADAMKELPTTLLLRPVNFETLATLLYAEAARGTYEEGAIAALMIVLTGTLPVILLVRHQMTRQG
ncbi:iron ABC transporter permease [Buttiauxella sp. S04-F03]|uniref:ABC transporter permease n=1 Tax=Buttiauxella sp. W03-F01 TaxID=2904524 RepID=UPI001E5C2CE8|nr:iron ABC transporter permease [Buttiauxella sp. W03-F01]MCE0800451.1 iron ABC transporter permease [Buttiauxella sp. W03-F01]